jgi:hypothetical protein
MASRGVPFTFSTDMFPTPWNPVEVLLQVASVKRGVPSCSGNGRRMVTFSIVELQEKSRE